MIENMSPVLESHEGKEDIAAWAEKNIERIDEQDAELLPQGRTDQRSVNTLKILSGLKSLMEASIRKVEVGNASDEEKKEMIKDAIASYQEKRLVFLKELE
jgi:hypothetical protein